MQTPVPMLLVVASLLLVLGGLGAGGAPFLKAPDLRTCAPYILEELTKQVDCCIYNGHGEPVTVDWKPPGPTSRPRVRRPAHLMEESRVEQLNRAFQLQKMLPDEDPRSAASRVRMHCAYCAFGIYRQQGSLNVEVHLNWMFVPWHRMYTYFQERILGELVGDDTLALPFWQWDDQTPHRNANPIPPMFLEQPALADALRHERCWLRDPAPRPFLDFGGVGPITDKPPSLINNHLLMQAIVAADVPSLFYGDAHTMAHFELVHGSIHLWMGNFSTATGQGEDMGAAYSAPHDPIFFSHHSNVDRLWELWKDGMRARGRSHLLYPDDPAYLDSEFLLNNEHGELVRIKVRDALVDHDQLGYTFEQVEPPSWMTGQSTSTPDHEEDPLIVQMPIDRPPQHHIRSETPFRPAANKHRVIANLADELVLTSGESVTLAALPRPLPLDGATEVLLVRGVSTRPLSKLASFDVYINLPQPPTGGAQLYNRSSANYLGTFTTVPVYNMHPRAQEWAKHRVQSTRWGLRLKLVQLVAQHSAALDVTVVPRANTPEIRIQEIAIQSVTA